MKKSLQAIRLTALSVMLGAALIYFSATVLTSTAFGSTFWLNSGFVLLNILAFVEREQLCNSASAFLRAKKDNPLLNTLTVLALLCFCAAVYTYSA